MPKIYVLVGPNAGKSGVWGGFKFTDGKATVPDAEGVHNLLTSFYSAWPEEEAEAKQAAYEAEQAGLPEELKAAVPVEQAPEAPVSETGEITDPSQEAGNEDNPQGEGEAPADPAPTEQAPNNGKRGKRG